MKKIIEFFEPPIMRLCLMIFISMAALAGYNWISWSCLTASDWGTWVGAVGTVGALIGTIAIANRQNNDRREAEINLAALVAVRFLPDITASISILASVERGLETRVELGQPQNYSRSGVDLQSACNWTASDLIPLSALPNHTAFHLEHARGLVRLAESEFFGRDSIFIEREVEILRMESFFPKHMFWLLRNAMDSLSIARTELQKIVPRTVDSFYTEE